MSAGPVRLVARREFVERIRDKGFLISTGITLSILVLFVGASALMAQTSSYDLAIAGAGAEAIAERVVAEAEAAGVEVRLRPAASAGEAERAVREGEADAALVDGDRIVVLADPPEDLVQRIQRVSALVRSEAALGDAGLTAEAIAEALAQPPLPVDALEPVDRREREYAAIGFVGVLALYGQLFAYGYWVASGVVEEKSSRVVEVLLATLRPSQLLRGKVLGIGVLGLVQLAVIGAVGFAATQVLGGLRFPGGALVVIGVVLFWFVLGYFFYASLFAVAGAIVPRQEDLQSTMTPLSIVIIVAFFLGIEANQNPDSMLAVVASFLPPSAPLVMPSRLILGEASAWEAILSVAISVAATLALIPVATKIYARAVLQPGKVKVRQVLRDRAATA